MVTPSPNPAAFDGHWLTPRQMAELLGITAMHLARLAREGKMPAEAVRQSGYGMARRYDAGAVLAWQRQRQQERR